MYQKFVKRLIDIILSGMALLVLAPLIFIIIIAIKIDDPGTAFFSQKRVGKDKTYFTMHKFRSMKMSTPHDVALWNQFDLVEERDKYGANSVKPGLTGWAQINGRDTLKIPEKAKFDGEYAQNLSFAFDLKCFFRTIGSVFTRSGVVEGGTGEMGKRTKQ